MKYLIGLMVVFTLLSCNKKKDGIKPKLGNITESIYASGVIKAENQYVVYSTNSGILKKINVAVGQAIIKGQLLFEIENEKAELNTENARLTYQLSQNSNSFIQDKISEIEMKVISLNDKLVFDKSIYERSKRLKAQDVIAEVDFEKTELAYKTSKLNYESAQKELSQLKSQLQNEQKKNNINLKINQKSQNDFNIKSDLSGQLFDILVKEGALISPQTPMAIIGKKNSFLLELNVDENDMVRLKLNQDVLVSMDSYKNQIFEATVDKIYPIMDERSRTFKIEAHFVNPPKKLYPNLSAEANIVIQTKKNTLIIPKNYLLKNDSVIIADNVKRKVKIGLSDYEKVEILDGLKAEETIYKPQ
jgi:HlyD family secretion protein